MDGVINVALTNGEGMSNTQVGDLMIYATHPLQSVCLGHTNQEPAIKFTSSNVVMNGSFGVNKAPDANYTMDVQGKLNCTEGVFVNGMVMGKALMGVFYRSNIANQQLYSNVAYTFLSPSFCNANFINLPGSNFTVPVSGYYSISGLTLRNTPSISGSTAWIPEMRVKKDGSVDRYAISKSIRDSYGQTSYEVPFEKILYLSTTDVFQVYPEYNLLQTSDPMIRIQQLS